VRPNALGISGGAPIDREGCWADSHFQKSSDLAGAERRPLHALVGPLSSYGVGALQHQDAVYG
jgi:hypothetical protein